MTIQTGDTQLHYDCTTYLSSKVSYSALWPLALPVQVQVHKQTSASLTCTHSTSSYRQLFAVACLLLPQSSFKLEMVAF